MEYSLIKILTDKKILDSYQFINSIKFKLFSANISLEALKSIVNEQFNQFDKKRDQMMDEAFEFGEASIKYEPDIINYLGIDINRTVVIDKLIIEIFSILHSFFDNFAQCINSSLYANKGKQSIKKVTFFSIIDMLDNFPEYSGEFIDKLKNVQNTEEYKFIRDFNNIIKHRHQIFIKGKFNLFNGEKSLMIPKFYKDENYYNEEEVIKIINNCYNMCESIFNQYICFVEMYFTINDNKYVYNRIYNPKTELVFKNKEDYEMFRNPINSIHYIEIEETRLLPEYEVLLISINDDIEKVEMYNSVYDFIAVRDINTKDYIGYLVPKDNKTYEMNDGRLIEYRQYILKKTNYKLEIAKIIVDTNFKYFPLLSDAKIIILNSSDESQEQ